MEMENRMFILDMANECRKIISEMEMENQMFILDKENEYAKMKSDMEMENWMLKLDMANECRKIISEMKYEYWMMNLDMVDDYRKMISVMKKKISSMKSVRKRVWMTSLMDNKVSKMNSDMKNEFSKMTSDMIDKFSKMNSDMKDKFSNMSPDMKNNFSKICSDMKKNFSKMSSDMNKEFLKMTSEMKNKISKMKSYMETEFPKKSEKKKQSSKKRADLSKKQKRRNRRFIRYAGSSDADTNGRETTVERQKIHKNYNCSCHGTKLMKSACRFGYTVLPCAGGTDPGRSQRGNQDHSQIYQASLKFVSKCPLSSEYMNKTLEKCVDVCGRYIKDGNCTYHCMRDSSKTRLVEFCARPKILFEFCPEYDPVDQTFQKDTASLCNSTSNHTYYTSSDIYFCNPDNCLQLLESDVRSSATTLMTEATEMNGGDIQEVWPLHIWPLILLLGVGVIVLAIFLACILHKRRHFRDHPRKEKMTKNVLTEMQKLVKG